MTLKKRSLTNWFTRNFKTISYLCYYYKNKNDTSTDIKR
jgi:hypothetical protein